MNVCAVCGEAMSEGEAFCAHCGASVAPPAKQPGAWRRVVTGIIGFPVVTIGLSLVAWSAYLFAAGCNDDDWGLCAAFGIVLGASGVGITLVGAPFALAAIVPFGTTRRILVSLGAAASGAAFFGISLVDEGAAAAATVAGLAAAGLFWLAYQVAR